MNINNSRNSSSNSVQVEYPILYCKVVGRILTPVKPRKGQKSMPKPKVQPFCINIPVKVEPFESDESGEPIEPLKPIDTRSLCLVSKYSIGKDSNIVYDKLEIIARVGKTKIRD